MLIENLEIVKIMVPAIVTVLVSWVTIRFSFKGISKSIQASREQELILRKINAWKIVIKNSYEMHYWLLTAKSVCADGADTSSFYDLKIHELELELLASLPELEGDLPPLMGNLRTKFGDFQKKLPRKDVTVENAYSNNEELRRDAEELQKRYFALYEFSSRKIIELNNHLITHIYTFKEKFKVVKDVWRALKFQRTR